MTFFSIGHRPLAHVPPQEDDRAREDQAAAIDPVAQETEIGLVVQGTAIDRVAQGTETGLVVQETAIDRGDLETAIDRELAHLEQGTDRDNDRPWHDLLATDHRGHAHPVTGRPDTGRPVRVTCRTMAPAIGPDVPVGAGDGPTIPTTGGPGQLPEP